MSQPSKYTADKGGHYGSSEGKSWGGRYAPEVLMPALLELEQCFEEAKNDKTFQDELTENYRDFVGRPTPLLELKNLTKELGGAQIFLKNEGLAHTGAHKINHCVGQILLAKRMGKKRILAETGAGQHGLATSTVSARFGMDCTVYMGQKDADRQRPNVFWMETLGATVEPVTFGGQRLKDAVNAALKDWITNVETSHYLIGSCLGPHPFPEINRYFQAIVGQEIRQQMKEKCGGLPDYIIACVGGGSNAIGAFNEFFHEDSVNLIGVEAGGSGIKPGQHAARFEGGKPGVVEGYKSYWLQDTIGQIEDTKSISAGLDYAGIGPLHAYLNDCGRVEYTYALDKEVLEAVKKLAQTEGLISALESAHALAEAIKLAPTLGSEKKIVVNMSGRGEKDLFIFGRHLESAAFRDFISRYAKELE